MTIAIAGLREINGVAVAVINLKLIWDVIEAIHVGSSGDAFILGHYGSLVAHSDIGLVLRGNSDPALARLKRLRDAIIASTDGAAEGRNAAGHLVIAAMAPIPGPDWVAFVEQPITEAFAPIRSALWRTGSLLLAGAAFAVMLSYLLARHMVAPIKALGIGVARIGGGDLEQRIVIRLGDELEVLGAAAQEAADALREPEAERRARG
jgi:adenylate cyclase